MKQKGLVICFLILGQQLLAQEKVKTFHANGNLLSAGIEYDGKPIGDWSFYYEDGSLQSTIKYRSGFVVQKKEYYKTGELRTSIYMLNGSSHMQSYFYYLNGNIKKEGQYNIHNMEIGEWSYYDEMGELIKTESYIKGKVID